MLSTPGPGDGDPERPAFIYLAALRHGFQFKLPSFLVSVQHNYPPSPTLTVAKGP